MSFFEMIAVLASALLAAASGVGFFLQTKSSHRLHKAALDAEMAALRYEESVRRLTSLASSSSQEHVLLVSDTDTDTGPILITAAAMKLEGVVAPGSPFAYWDRAQTKRLLEEAKLMGGLSADDADILEDSLESGPSSSRAFGMRRPEAAIAI